jgi:CDP-paratose synthetase
MTIINNCEVLGSEIDVDVGTGVAPTIKDFVELVHRLTKSTSKLLFGSVPYRAHEAMHCQADISLLTKIGWSPQYSLESGIKKTIQIESENKKYFP